MVVVVSSQFFNFLLFEWFTFYFYIFTQISALLPSLMKRSYYFTSTCLLFSALKLMYVIVNAQHFFIFITLFGSVFAYLPSLEFFLLHCFLLFPLSAHLFFKHLQSLFDFMFPDLDPTFSINGCPTL